MIANRVFAWWRFRPGLLQLVVGSVAVALAISLGMVWISSLLGFGLGPAIPSSLAAVGAALFAARTRAGDGRPGGQGTP